MEPQVIAAIISGSIGAFAGISRALGNFNKKLDRRFENIEKNVERNLDKLKNEVLHDYVLKEDFLREMQAVHTKLDRILDHLLNHTN